MRSDFGSRQLVRELVSGVVTSEALEAQAQEFALKWIDSGAGLFRIERPNIPDPHLCVYAVLIDDVARKVLVTDHVKANAWLCPGGHVDVGEDPRHTVLRETREELAIQDPRFHARTPDGEPFFLSVTRTRGHVSHTDVTFWFLLDGREGMALTRDPAEARELRWFDIDDESVWADIDRFDPAMPRFLQKLTAHLDAPLPVG